MMMSHARCLGLGVVCLLSGCLELTSLKEFPAADAADSDPDSTTSKGSDTGTAEQSTDTSEHDGGMDGGMDGGIDSTDDPKDGGDPDAGSDTDPIAYAPPVLTSDQASPISLDYDVSSTVITGTIVSEAGLEAVTIRWTAGATELGSNRITDFSDSPVVTTDNRTYTLSYEFIGVNQDLTVEISAVDRLEQPGNTLVIEIHPAVKVPLKPPFTVVMGGPDNDRGGAASLLTGQVFLLSNGDAKNNAAKVDIIYFVGEKKEALYSPSQSEIRTEVEWVVGWSTYNHTALAYSLQPFEDVNFVHELGNENLNKDVVGLLTVGDVIAFKTQSGKRGLFEVSSLTAGEAGTITLIVKVEA